MNFDTRVALPASIEVSLAREAALMASRLRMEVERIVDHRGIRFDWYYTDGRLARVCKPMPDDRRALLQAMGEISTEGPDYPPEALE